MIIDLWEFCCFWRRVIGTMLAVMENCRMGFALILGILSRVECRSKKIEFYYLTVGC